jgi:Na+/melibiose symporter-like transporter
MFLSMAAVAFRLSGLFPPNESVWFLPLLGSFSVVGGFLSVVGAMVVFSMTADLADEQEYRFKTRQEGVLASGIAFSTKAVGSVGVVVAGFLLEYFIGFPVGQAASEIDEEVLFRLAITDALIVNSFILIPAFLITRYSLTAESMGKIQSELRSRRAA